MTMEQGTVFGNRYTLEQRIAVGGMGEVWRATDKVLGREVAIKLLSPNLAQQPGFTERFREEARHTALLGHPNIATVYDYGEDDGASWLVMELVEGEPLSQILRDQGAQSPRRTAMIIGQCAEALQAAHEAGVIHRDVKPANIMVRPDGTVKLTDFGIARAKDAAPMTRTGEVMGTAQYISPEQAMGKPVSPASDIYSLGCVAHEMLSGRRPFDDGSPVATAMAHVHKPAPELPASVPPAMAAVVMSCLAKDPAHRPTSAKAVAQAMKGGPAAAAAAVPAAFEAARARGDVPATEQMTSPTAYARPLPEPVPVTTRRADTRDERRGPAPWVWVIFALLAALALWAILRMTGVVGNDSRPSTPPPSTTSIGPTTPSTSSSSSSSTTTTNVSIAPGQFVKKSPDELKGFADAKGLQIQETEPVYSDTIPKGLITWHASGAFAPGSIVKYTVSLGPQPTTTSTPPSPSDPPSTPTTSKKPAAPPSPTGPPASAGALGRLPGVDG